MAFLSALDAKIQSLLQGEPVRIIGLGAVVVVWLATHVAFALGWAHQPPSWDQIELAVSAAILALNELLRQFVYSPSSVSQLQAVAAAASVQPAPVDPIVAPADTTTDVHTAADQPAEGDGVAG